MSGSLLTRTRPDIWVGGLALATSLTGYVYAPKLPAAGRIWACGGYYEAPPTPEQEIKSLRRELESHRRRLEEVEKEIEDGGDDTWGYKKIYGEAIEQVKKELKDLGVEDAPPTPEEIERARIERVKKDLTIIDADIERHERDIDAWKKQIHEDQKHIDDTEKKIEELRKKRQEKEAEMPKAETAPLVWVPEGAMEWLLHEVGHFVASSPEERRALNYGLGPSEHGPEGDREWQAWAFEDLILLPHGPARDLAPPTQRDGAAFSRVGPIDDVYHRHVGRQVDALGLDVEQWRRQYGDWVRWGQSMGDAAPWKTAT